MPERVVITASEVARVDAERLAGPPPPRPVVTIPWWGVVLGGFLIFCLPLLCLGCISVLIAIRGKDPLRLVWMRFLCTLLIISGLLTSMATAYLWFVKSPSGQTVSAQLPLGLVSHDLTDSFPTLPASSAMTAVEIAAKTKPLVFIVMPDPGRSLRDAYLENAPLGAGTLLLADETGYLLATNRHV